MSQRTSPETQMLICINVRCIWYIYICMCKVCVTGRFAHICSKFRLFPWDWSQTNWAGFNPPSHLSNAHSKTFSKEQLHSEKDYSSSEHVFFGCWISLYYSFLSQGMMMFSYSQIFSKDTFQTYISLQHVLALALFTCEPSWIGLMASSQGCLGKLYYANLISTIWYKVQTFLVQVQNAAQDIFHANLIFTM